MQCVQSVRHASGLWKRHLGIPKLHIYLVWQLADASRSCKGGRFADVLLPSLTDPVSANSKILYPLDYLPRVCRVKVVPGGSRSDNAPVEPINNVRREQTGSGRVELNSVDELVRLDGTTSTRNDFHPAHSTPNAAQTRLIDRFVEGLERPSHVKRRKTCLADLWAAEKSAGPDHPDIAEYLYYVRLLHHREEWLWRTQAREYPYYLDSYLNLAKSRDE